MVKRKTRRTHVAKKNNLKAQMSYPKIEVFRIEDLSHHYATTTHHHTRFPGHGGLRWELLALPSGTAGDAD
jgi:hypothetical protein